MAPVLFFGTGCWFITWYFFLCNHGWELIDFASYISVAIGGCYGAHHLVVVPVCHLASASTTAASAAITHAYACLHFPVCPVDIVLSSRLQPLPTGTPTATTKHSYNVFLSWFCKQALLAASIPIWTLFVSHFNMRSYFLLLIALPTSVITTSAPPSMAVPASSAGKPHSSIHNDILARGVCPTILSGSLLFWIDLLQSLPIPVWFITPLLCLASMLLLGGFSFVLWFWADYALDAILDARHPHLPARLSLLPDLYEGIWLGPPRRRKRRSSGPGPCPPKIMICPFLPSPGWILCGMAYLLLLSGLKFALTDLPIRDPTKSPSVSPTLLTFVLHRTFVPISLIRTVLSLPAGLVASGLPMAVTPSIF